MPLLPTSSATAFAGSVVSDGEVLQRPDCSAWIFGTGEITKVESADDGSQELTIKFDNGKKLKMQGTTVKFPTEVSKPSLAPETEAKTSANDQAEG